MLSCKFPCVTSVQLTAASRLRGAERRVDAYCIFMPAPSVALPPSITPPAARSIAAVAI